MREEKRVITVDDFEQNLMINGINVPKEIVEFYNNDEAKIIKEMTGIPVKSGMKTLF